MRALVMIFLLLTASLPAGATHYYISYSAGSNSNNGTSESTPWKSHPYMQNAVGCAGSLPSYTHSAGDIFTFKQGDSWPNACFDMSIQGGGTLSGSSCTATDTYTFDPTWGTAGGTTGNVGQAVGTYQFTGGGSVISGSDGYNAFIFDASAYPCITFNGMELTGMHWNASSPGSYGSETMVYIGTGENVTVSNIYAHGWTYSNPATDGDTLNVMLGSGASPYNAGSRLTGSVIDGVNSGGAGVSNSGEVAAQIPLLDNNIVRNMSNGLLPNINGKTHDNLIGPINPSFDTVGDHENCIEPIGAAASNEQDIYNNVWHDCYAVALLTQGTGGSGVNEVDYIWNNVAYIGSQATPPIPMEFDSADAPNTGSSVHEWNNTIYAGSSFYCMRTVTRGNGNYAILDVQNNHCISGQGTISLGPTGNTYINNNNVLMSLATASSQGYTSSETFAYSPTLNTNGTVGAGVNLTSNCTGNQVTLCSDTTYGGTRSTTARPSSGAWDTGAYEFSGTPAPAAPAAVHVILLD
jgi:hypothetical protein